MATTVSYPVASTYAGEVAGEYILAAFLAAETLSNITVKENVPYKLKYQRLTDSATSFNGHNCTFTPGGTVTLSERTLTLVPLGLDRELCKTTFYSDWQALAAQNGDITKVADALVTTMGGLIGQITENMIWKGTAGTGAFDGFETLFAADASVIDGANDAAIDESNVLDVLKAVVVAMPIAVRRAVEKPKLFVSSAVAEHFRNAIINVGAGATLMQGDAAKMTWNGQYEIVESPGMNTNSIVFAQASNLWFGTNKLSDDNNINVIDMQPVNGDKTVRFSATMFGSVQYGFGSEIVYYTHA